MKLAPGTVCPRCGAGRALPGPVAEVTPTRCRCTRYQLQEFAARQGSLALPFRVGPSVGGKPGAQGRLIG